jgi:hypothetical protein
MSREVCLVEALRRSGEPTGARVDEAGVIALPQLGADHCLDHLHCVASFRRLRCLD